MKRTATCYNCSHDFKVEADTLKPGKPLPCPKCEHNCYFKVPPELEEIEAEEVKP